MRYPVRPLILVLLCFLLVISCSLPRFSAQEVSQQIIRVLDDRSEEELVLDYIIVTPHFTPTPTFTPTLTPTVQAEASGLEQSVPAGDGSTVSVDPTAGASAGETPPPGAPVASPTASAFTATPLSTVAIPVPTATTIPSATPLPPGVPSATPLPPPTSPPPTSPPSTSPPPTSPRPTSRPVSSSTPPPPSVKVGFSAANFTVNEGGGSVVIQVVLSAPSAQPVTVAYASNNSSATAGNDYNAVNGLLVFNPGQTSQNFTLTIIDDNLANEAGETVILRLSSAANASLGLAATTLTIVDNDPSIQFAQASYLAGEGDGTAAVTVILSAASAVPVRVDYRTDDGSAAAGSDYTALNGTLTIPPGLTSGSFDLPLIEDMTVEPDETVQLTLSNPVNGTLGLAGAILTIEDNDLLPSVQFSSATYNVLEDAGTALITVELSAPSPQTVTVSYATSDGTATTADYGASAGVVNIPAGSTGGSFTVPIIDDVWIESPETVILALSAPVNATLGATSGAVLTITSNDADPVVNTTDDGDDGACDGTHCSLREAILTANGNPGSDTITFDIPGGGPYTISPQTVLPPLTEPVTLDGLSQPGADCNTPLIEVDGSQAGGNAHGLRLNGGNSLVRGLVINRFSKQGIRINSDDNTLRCNYIGSDISGSNPAGNGGDGVFVTADSTGNRLEDNVIFSNGGLGIDLETNGVTANDSDDGDSGANELQNFPILTDANSIGPFLHVSGTLNSTPSSSYRLEFFANSSCDPSGNGEGERPLDTVTRSTNSNGDDVFLFIIIPVPVPPGQFITATATDSNGNTSEFSACQVVN